MVLDESKPGLETRRRINGGGEGKLPGTTAQTATDELRAFSQILERDSMSPKKTSEATIMLYMSDSPRVVNGKG